MPDEAALITMRVRGTDPGCLPYIAGLKGVHGLGEPVLLAPDDDNGDAADADVQAFECDVFVHRSVEQEEGTYARITDAIANAAGASAVTWPFCVEPPVVAEGAAAEQAAVTLPRHGDLFCLYDLAGVQDADPAAALELAEEEDEHMALTSMALLGNVWQNPAVADEEALAHAAATLPPVIIQALDLGFFPYCCRWMRDVKLRTSVPVVGRWMAVSEANREKMTALPLPLLGLHGMTAHVEDGRILASSPQLWQVLAQPV